MSVRRLHSVARFQVLRQVVPQIGRIADAVEGAEGYDPNGLLVSATDTAGGVSVSLAAAGGVSATPADAVGWSVPLRDVAGARISEIGGYLVEGYCRAIVKSAPTGIASPSNIYAYVGIASDGPLSTATKALVYAVGNSSANAWAVRYIRLASGTWTTTGPATASAAVTGVHGTWGAPNLGGGTTAALMATNLPSPQLANSLRDFTTINLAGADPHLIFGFGWSDTPAGDDGMTARFLAKYLPSPTET